MRVGLISCSAKKLDYAASAEDFYRGPLYTLSRKWISKRVDQWGILSAQYGLVMPSQVIEPYDLKLSGLPRLQQREWARAVHEQLMIQWGADVIYMVLAGCEYRAALGQMPMVEDVIAHWSKQRKEDGMSGRRAVVGIGVLKRYLTNDVGYC